MNFGQRTECLISRGGESAKVRHQSKVLAVKTAAQVMYDNPNCPDSFAMDVKGHQQRFFDQRSDRGEVIEIKFGMRKKQRGVAVQHRPARPKIARRAAADMLDPLPGNGGPVEPLSVRLQ